MHVRVVDESPVLVDEPLAQRVVGRKVGRADS
jgi:hypothetical protein